ncbi:hypothetical protein O181_046208 [Austropuccinia psidii MF-1]|uniref:Secreted protein n=1 Tax=Austropuccinia psidii MF-1 TaxID=1389203 RepID=A0A9Q3DRT7_9BASI|nr:hypothetical protein [Austropuccinia psidii MF-1]
MHLGKNIKNGLNLIQALQLLTLVPTWLRRCTGATAPGSTLRLLHKPPSAWPSTSFGIPTEWQLPTITHARISTKIGGIDSKLSSCSLAKTDSTHPFSTLCSRLRIRSTGIPERSDAYR